MVRVILLLAVVACRAKPDEVSCGAVAGRFLTLAHKELDAATLDPKLRRSAADQLPAMRDALAEICKDSAWSASVRGCLVRADDHEAFEACERQLSEDQRAALDRAAAGRPQSP
jgi:hypothetical protein